MTAAGLAHAPAVRARPARRSPLRAGALAISFLFLAALVAVAPPSAAASTTFGRPDATATFGQGIVFRQPVTFGGPHRRVELLVERPGSLGPHAISVPVPATPRETTLVHRWNVATHHLTPNTTLTARWRVTLEDGTFEVGPQVSVRYEDTRFRWQTREGRIVRVHWHEGTDAFGRRALEIGERAVQETSELLGVTETEPIDFFIYANVNDFYDALGPGTRENVGGQANAEIRTLFALIGPGAIDAPWVSTVIPHELVHLVFDTAVKNPYHFPPRWLNEGLAVYLSEGYGSQDRAAVERAARDGSLIPLDGLTGQFPTTRDRFFLAYAESVSAVDYLVRIHGRDALVRLITTYAGGVSDDAAFTEALGMDVAAFDAAWREDLRATEPAVYGPRPAPPGPLPPEWQQSPPSPAPGSTDGAPAPTGRPDATTAPGAGGGFGGGASGDLPVPLILAIAALIFGALGILLLVYGRRRSRPLSTGAVRAQGEETGAGPAPDPEAHVPLDPADRA